MNASPTQLLGLPRGAAEIAEDVLRRVQGQVPAERAPTVRTFYLVVGLLLLLLGALLAMHLLRAPGWRLRLGRASHRRWFLARTAAEDPVLPMAILVVVPLAIGWTASRSADIEGGRRFRLWTLPDLGVALLAMAAVALTLGLWKVSRLVRTKATLTVS